MTLVDQRSADAAAFEDWSEWASLGCLEGKRYYCLLSPSLRFFDICVPSNHPIIEMVTRIPGARRDRLTITEAGCYRMPAQNWRSLRSALPRIKAATLRWILRREAEHATFRAVALVYRLAP